MAKSLKQLMGMSEQALIALGAQYGLTFHEGMKKSHMASQLSQSAASGWMEVNSELMSGVEETYDDSGSAMMFEGHTSLSDAAHLAQIISGAGYTEAFHEAMNGPSHHVEAVASYLGTLGVSTDDVWMHMPKANPNMPARHWGALNEYLRDGLTKHQDIMPEIAGHYSSNFMDEFSTNKGGVQQSYEYLAHMYVNRDLYTSASSFNHDISLVTSRLQSQMGGRFKEVAFGSAIGAPSAYINALPRLGNQDIVRGIQHPRQALNASGLPMGAMGSGINPEYSLSASLTGQPGWSEVSRGVHSDISETAKSLARVYSGDTGLNASRVETSDRDQILDSASRYADIFDVRHGYENLKRDVGDEPSYSGSAIRAVLENANDYNEAETSTTFDPAQRIRSVMAAGIDGSFESGGAFSATFGPATFSNPAYERREARRIADLDAAHANFRDVSGYGSGRNSGVQYHDVEQGSQEWLDLRAQFDITGSTVGAMLGNNESTRPWAEMIDRLGLKRGEGSKNNAFTQRMFAAGHATEDAARKRVSEMLGVPVSQTGAISNPDFPGMLYSPDGLIGDDTLWEHKNPENSRAGFADLLAGDHPDYMDQIQMGMAMTGRSRTLFSQTRRGETRDQWIDADPTWYERNKTRLDSIRGRLAAGREWLEQNPGADNDKDRIAGARAAMTGEGIWRDISQRSNRGFSATAGTESDPFIRGESGFTGRDAGSDYQPNFTHYTPQYPATTSGSSSTGTELTAQAVKEGILSAQEENRQKRLGSGNTASSDAAQEADADFDDLGNPRGWSRRRIDDALGEGGGGNRGGGGGGRSGPDWFTGGNAGGDIVRGLAGGSISSLTSGAMTALARTPWGMVAAAGIGAARIGNELAETANESLGIAQDYGFTNPVAYAGQTQGMEMLGLSERQAANVVQTTHSAYNTMLNGDPSGAIRIVQATRGLLTIGDFRETKGDTVALARIAQERGQERGWSQERIAGAMEMAGLQGLARTNQRGEASFRLAEQRRDAGASADTSEAVEATQSLQTARRLASPEYAAQSEYFESGAELARTATKGIVTTIRGVQAVSEGAKTVYDFIKQEESGGREFGPDGQLIQGIDPTTGKPSGARGSMQVTDSTMRDPGLPGLKGIDPKTATPEQRAQFGRDYYDALVSYYGGDQRKAQAAYTDGFGTVDNAVIDKGTDWLTAVPMQARNRVARFDEWQKTAGEVSEGASGFTRNGVSYGQTPTINVNIKAQVNNQQASASVSSSGQTVNQTINMGNGANQRR